MFSGCVAGFVSFSTLLDFRAACFGFAAPRWCAMPKDNKYRRFMKEYASPSPPPPPPPKRRTSAVTVSAPVCTEQVFEFSYFNRAGTVSIATEPAAQVSRPDTPFPEQSSQAAGVSDFTPSRPGVVVMHDMSAGPSTSGVLGGGPAQQAVGDGPVSR